MDRDNIESSYRDNKGRFAKGYKASDVPIEYRIKQAIAMSDAWRKSDKYIGDLKNQHPYLFNSWRAILYTKKGKKAGVEVTDIDIDWLIENILTQKCVYCGDDKRIGCDRVDNSKGHTKDNVVPCCVECNIARSNLFTFEEMKVIGKSIRSVKEQRKLART